MIITLEDIKNSTIYDPLITDEQYNTYIHQIESLFLKIRCKELFSIEGVALSGTSEITGVTFYDSLKARYLDFADDGVNHFLITKIKEVSEDNYTIEVNGTFDSDYLDFVIYPRNSDMFALSGIDYLYLSGQKSGMKSEKIGNYSYTKEDDIDKSSGLPYSISGLVEKYVR